MSVSLKDLFPMNDDEKLIDEIMTNTKEFPASHHSIRSLSAIKNRLKKLKTTENLTIKQKNEARILIGKKFIYDSKKNTKLPLFYDLRVQTLEFIYNCPLTQKDLSESELSEYLKDRAKVTAFYWTIGDIIIEYNKNKTV